jgi:GNAT superfamily N-acetyltransferase
MERPAETPVIRALAPADHAGLADLMIEMQAHYGVPCPARAEILAGLAGLPDGVEILVAQCGDALVGFASACPLYPGPGLQPGFFLKEIYVAAAGRGAGIGRALMTQLAALAVARGYRRLDWTADADDPALLRFYESLGGEPHPKKLFFRLTGDALAEAAAQARSLD